MHDSSDAPHAATEGILAELRAALKTPRFWVAVALQGIPVVG